VGCHTCDVACRDAHDLFDGAKRRWVVRAELAREGQSLSWSCLHCQKPPCVEACPTGAMGKNPEDGSVTLNPEICSACGSCAEACPYKAVWVDPNGRAIQKCDLCSGKEVLVCVESCPQNALEFGWLEDLEARYPSALRGFPHLDRTPAPALLVCGFNPEGARSL